MAGLFFCELRIGQSRKPVFAVQYVRCLEICRVVDLRSEAYINPLIAGLPTLFHHFLWTIEQMTDFSTFNSVGYFVQSYYRFFIGNYIKPQLRHTPPDLHQVLADINEYII